MNNLSIAQKKTALVILLWVFFLLSIGDMKFPTWAYFTVGVGLLTAAIVAVK